GTCRRDSHARGGCGQHYVLHGTQNAVKKSHGGSQSSRFSKYRSWDCREDGRMDRGRMVWSRLPPPVYLTGSPTWISWYFRWDRANRMTFSIDGSPQSLKPTTPPTDSIRSAYQKSRNA